MLDATGTTCGEPTYLLTDHLGSTSITTNAAGTVTSALRYTPWGEVRYTWGIPPTDYTFTARYSNVEDFGLYYYNARWYDGQLGRFAQADSIIPEQTQGTQAWDRYAGMNNNPVRYSDPSGHSIFDAYMQGWANCSSAWSIITNVNAPFENRLGASAYVTFWVGAHVLGATGLVLGGAAIVQSVTAASTVTTAATTACADGDCTNETSTLTSMAETALESPGAQALSQQIANQATQNPGSGVVSLGSNGYYQAPGYTYFELPGKAWSALEKAGIPYVEAVNRQFMNTQMALGKDFGIRLNPAFAGKMGYYTKMEYDMLIASEKYINVAKAGFDYYFVPK